MEANKENIKKIKSISKIPLPVQPLPALPKHLVENKKMFPKKEIQYERHPLRTLNSQPHLTLPGPSKNALVFNKTKSTLKSESRITLRHREEDLDWDYKVFKDDACDYDSVITISDDDGDDASEENNKLVIQRDKKSFGESRSATPALKSLEPSRVKNIKRSLKRPHSRELQGLSPLVKDKKNGDQKVRRRLCFNEPLAERLMSPDFWKKSYMNCLRRDYATDMFAHLLNMEKPIVPRISSVMRACVINWLMKVNGPDGNPAIVQSACWYLDSVLGTGQVIVDKLQLICAACYWISNKLHGPGLSASKLAKYSNYAFSNASLLNAEKEVLQRLNFPCQPVVPQDFINYFSWWCDREHPGEIEVGATFLCMCGVMVDKSLCTEYASVIAAAAVRNSVILLRDKTLLKRLQECPVFQAAEKKATNLLRTCHQLQRSARIVSSTAYEYKAPLEQYGTPPHYIAQKIINAFQELHASC